MPCLERGWGQTGHLCTARAGQDHIGQCLSWGSVWHGVWHSRGGISCAPPTQLHMPGPAMRLLPT